MRRRGVDWGGAGVGEGEGLVGGGADGDAAEVECGGRDLQMRLDADAGEGALMGRVESDVAMEMVPGRGAGLCGGEGDLFGAAGSGG